MQQHLPHGCRTKPPPLSVFLELFTPEASAIALRNANFCDNPRSQIDLKPLQLLLFNRFLQAMEFS
ncbi:hypothetical protein [Trichocoleus sp. FACHB-591]|uniref:hypothetical protein n=1 Tax=Trichocoleus sp. FACHB-591 TaxID=2692872 RepID=UPI001687A3B0|nr:hypothetical protein [Trichocoleus sp. FACHB-591]